MPEIVFQLERLAYYLFMVRADVNARMSRYADVLDALEPLAEPKPRISVKDRSTGFTLTQAEAFALFNGLDGDVYLATRVVKPILLRLEQASTDGSAIYDYPTITVEHVCPQTLPDNSQWAGWFTDPEAHSSRLHTLGNLVLLNFRKNAAARNFEFDIKKNQYFAPGNSCAFTLTNEVRAYAIHRYEGFEGVSISEYAGIDSVARMAALIAKHGALGAGLLEQFSGDMDQAESTLEDCYHGQFASLADYMEELTTESVTIPEALRYYVDWEAMARDAEMGGDLFTIETAHGEVHVFSSR